MHMYFTYTLLQTKDINTLEDLNTARLNPKP
jgi:hypothetical protein